ncbi:MAG: hypothetical protein WC822_06020 [Candidatus Paceibacterota bacterium]|jgi:hypothetical protein
MKTRAEVEALKHNWLNDGCWDIEDTEGFEDYKEELKEFRLITEREWQAKEYNRLHNRAVSLAIDNLGDGETKQLELMKYLEHLERRIESLEATREQDFNIKLYGDKN